jgi:hypothetical protein
MKDNIKDLIGREWCSMMAENSHHQGRDNLLREATKRGERPHYIMDVSQIWQNTPQDYEYWSAIKSSLW